MAARDIVINFLGNSAALQNAAAQGASGMDKFKARVSLAAVGIAGAAGAMGAKAIQIASDTGESASKVATLFGKSSVEINKFASNAANSYGMSKAEALDAVGAMGAVQIAMGVQADQAAKLSVEYVKLSADLGSFNNASSEEVAEALTNSLSGEYEMLKKYGIVINDVTLSAEAQRIGMKKTGATWDSAQKQQLSYNIIMKSTEKAQGDFGRTSDGMANQTKKLQATVTNLQGSLGEKLLPVVVKVMSFMNEAFGWMERHQTTTKVLAIVIGSLAAGIVLLAIGMKAMALATALNTGAWTLLSTVMWANPVFLIAGIILAIVAALVIAYAKVDWFRKGVDAAFGAVKSVIMGVFNWVKDHWGTIVTFLTGPIGWAVRTISGHWDSIKSAAKNAKDFIVNLFSKIGSAISAPFKTAFSAVKSAWNSTLGGKGFDFGGWDPPGPGSIPGISFRIPMMAKGGYAMAGRSHIVGERGPELFTPGTSGRVTSNEDMMGGSYVVEIVGNGDPSALEALIEKVTVRRDRRLVTSFAAGGRRSR